MRILFISTHNFATNPRLVKEIDLAIANKYKVSVLCCEFDNWSKGLNEKIKQRLLPQIEYLETDGSRRSFIPWLISSVWFLFAKAALLFLPGNVYFLSVQSNKRSWLLLKKIKRIEGSIDLVVAHNAGSFYPSLLFSKIRNIPLGIDLEDYHPGENTDIRVSKNLKALSKKILPSAAYVTAASAPILEKTLDDTGIISGSTSVILNYFPANEFLQPVKINDDKLKIVWFSQNIDQGRGLEEILPIIVNEDNVELHLYGNLKNDFHGKFLDGKKNIFIHAPLLQSELHNALCLYDVGLALENPASNFNRELCITNKLLAYFQAGLYIIASDTIAQKEFIKDHPEHGIIAALNEHSLFSSMQNVYAHKALIRSAANHRFENAKRYRWENESQKLLITWDNATSRKALLQ